MWSPIVLCLFVGLTFASNPGWKNDATYVYKLKGYNFANLDDVSQQQSGIVFKANLKLQPQEGKLRALLEKPKYAEVHAELPESWDPENEVDWKELPLTGKPFEVKMKDGIITDLIVSKDVPNWEVNFYKGAMSQFQLDTKAINVEDNEINSLPEDGDGDDDAVFVTREETVSGEAETLYLIRPLPNHVLQRRFEEASYLEEKGSVIEVMKHRNFNDSKELPSYSYGNGKMQWGKPAGNTMGQFLVRESTSRAVLTGSLRKFTVQQSYTYNKIVVSPTLSDNDKGTVVSVVNATLDEVQSQNEKIEEVPQPVNVGNLVYSYSTNPFSKSSNPSQKRTSSSRKHQSRNDENDYRRNNVRDRRSLPDYSDEDDDDDSSEEDYTQDKPQLKEAPRSPLLPYTIGFEGMSIKQQINVAKQVKELAKEVGKRMQDAQRQHHENLLDNFHTMISLVRIMNYDEIQEVAKDLYTNKYESSDRAAWTAFRDAVAEAGTGPALLTVSDWITSRKMSGEEASQVVSTMTDSVRQPTEEYVKALFKLATSPEVQHQWPLNDTILLGCTDVIRRVYVDNEQSDDRYPTKSFGSFDTEEGERFVKQQVMSHLNKELSNAVRNDETHKIHVFIRAIGNTGAYAALRIFEPYLEGRQQMSQFQRVQIILSMDRIVENHPQTSRAVLYRTYQNPAEDTQVRMAAVYQLMRTAPPAEMLQAMAMYTNIDDDDYVNAVVVSSIETACDLEGWEFIELREAAESAKPLLNDEKTYGFSHGANYLRSYVSDELSKIYKQSLQVYGSDDSAYPKGLQYKVREFQGGIKRITHNLEAVLSSMDDLLKVLYEQTAQFQQEEKEQKEKSQEQEKNQWSSQNIAKLLNLKSEETEQLEAFLFMEYGSNYYMTALDNRTVEDLADIMREYEVDLKKEKQINTYKLSTDEMAISFPTASGLPFLFTHDIPMFVKVEGKVSAKADSPIFEHGKINTPDKINFKADVRFVYSTKVQSRLSFIAPFSHKQHFAGFDKHMETNMPLSVEGEVDLKEKNVEIEIEFDNDQETPIFHYATVPYTSKMEVTSFEPLLTSHNTKIIKQDDLQGYENTFGKKSTGMAFRVDMQHSRRFFTSLDLARITKLGPKDAFQSLWDDNSIQYSHLNVNFSPEKSETNKAVIRLSYESKYRSQPDSDSDSEWILNENAEPAQRQEELMRKVAADIKNVQVNSVDACVEFKGQKKIKYIVTGAVAASKVDPKSRVMVSYKRKGNAEPQELHLVVKSYNPNTNALDVDYTLQDDPMTSNEIKIKFGGSESSLSKMDIQVEHRRSEERKHYLKQLPMYKQCKDEMRADNKQLPACVNMTQEANLLDRVDVKVRYENLDESLEDSIESAFNAITFFARAEVESNEKDGNENEIEMQARFHADLEAVNVTFKTQEQETTFFNVPIDDLTKEIVVSHPVFNLKSRLFSYVQELDTYTHFCTVDRNQVNTFSNNTYPTEISKHWTVMLQYLNGHSRKQHKSVEEQLRSQPENYVVLVRESPESSNKKEVKIVVSAPETDFELYEIDMSPSEGQTRGKVTVNDKQVKVSEKESEDIEDGYIQIYALPNGEIKVDIEDAFHAIYDGSRVRISTTDDKFRKRVVGICGQFTEQQDEDFLTPQANYAVDAEDFVRSLEVEGQNGKQMRESFRGRNDKTVEKELPLYVNVITNNDYDEGNNDKTTKNIGCTYFQTQYKEQGNEICFTLNPQPNCSSHCRPKKEMKKKVAVHCIKKSNVSNLWKKQIDNGSSPDFSNKSQDKSIYMSLPESCSP